MSESTFFQTLFIECPFAWRSKSYTLTRQIQFFPNEFGPTISFTATRKSKVLGYIPIIGSLIGISRIYNGILEYKLFDNTHLHSFSNRSIKWIARGVLETVPVLGGVICLIMDVIATILSRKSPNLSVFKDQTACGYCHACGFCKC